MDWGKSLVSKSKTPHLTMMPFLHWQILALLVTPCCCDDDAVVYHSLWLWAWGGDDLPLPGIFVNDAAHSLALPFVRRLGDYPNHC